MKTSNKWLLAALLLLLGALTTHNLALQAEYRRGVHKDLRSHMQALEFRDFDAVEVQAAHALAVQLEAGPYHVDVSQEAAPYIQVSQQGRRLLLQLNFPKDRVQLGGKADVIIPLPRLRQLVAGATYTQAGQLVTEHQDRRGWLRVQSFRQDSLLLTHDYATHVALEGNELGYLQATAGRQPGSQGVLRIEKSNRVQNANLRLHAQTELQLQAAAVGQLQFAFGDSAKATLTGAGLRNLTRP